MPFSLVCDHEYSSDTCCHDWHLIGVEISTCKHIPGAWKIMLTLCGLTLGIDYRPVGARP